MVQVNAIITLPPVTFELPARDPSKEKTVKVSPPSVYTGATSVQFRLISSEYREGQVSTVRENTIKFWKTSFSLTYCKFTIICDQLLYF